MTRKERTNEIRNNGDKTPTTTKIERKKKLEKKANEYLKSITLHGFTRVFIGKNKIESLFWLIVLLGGIGLTSLITYRLMSKLHDRSTYFEVSYISTKKNHFPALTFCHNLEGKDNFCGPHITFSLQYIERHPTRCIRPKPPNATAGNITISGSGVVWSNNYFQFSCGTSCKKEDLMKFKVTPEMHNCVSWNLEGDAYQLKGIIEFKVKLLAVKKDKQFTADVMLHDHKVYGPIQDNNVMMSSSSNYEVSIEKKITKRLKSPYESNCTDRKLADIFPMSYSRTGCLDSMRCLDGLKKCGDTYEFCYRYIPKNIHDQYYKYNNTEKGVRYCLVKDWRKEYFNHCPSACEESYYRKTVSTFQPIGDMTSMDKNELIFRLKFQEASAYQIHSENAMYGFVQLLCESGGFLGLILGGSILSVLEIMIYGLIKLSIPLV